MHLSKLLPLFALLFILVFTNCGEDEVIPPKTNTGELKLSTSLKKDFRLSDQYTCNGANDSPPLSWSNTFTDLQNYTLLISNGLTGADRKVYWMLWDISGSTTALESGVVPADAVEANAYSGPCPEAGQGKEAYTVQLFALSKNLGLPASTSEQALLDAMQGNILDEQTLSTYYSAFTISSNNFSIGGKIPIVHTCDGSHVSPHLQWKNGHTDAKAYALHVFDITAAGYLHWLLSDFESMAITEGVSSPAGSVSGTNDRGQTGYFGPCPQGASNRYSFRLYALDQKLDLEKGYSLADFENALEGHILDQTDFHGVYE